MGEGNCSTSHGKMVANWDTAPNPSLSCLLAVKHLLLPLSQEAGPLKVPCMSMDQAWKVFKDFLVYHSSQFFMGRKLASVTHCPSPPQATILTHSILLISILQST